MNWQESPSTGDSAERVQHRFNCAPHLYQARFVVKFLPEAARNLPLNLLDGDADDAKFVSQGGATDTKNPGRLELVPAGVSKDA